MAHKPHKFDGIFPKYVDSENSFLHYTCNSPVEDVLDKYGIEPKGNEHGCSNDLEVLKIPMKVYRKFGFPIKSKNDMNLLKLNLETLIRKLE